MDQQPSQAQVQGRSGRKNFLEERSVDSAGVHLGWEIVWKPHSARSQEQNAWLHGEGVWGLVLGPNWTKLGLVGLSWLSWLSWSKLPVA